MDDGSSTPPQLPPSETQIRRMSGSSSTPPQVSSLKTKSRSMDGSSTSTPPPQLPSNSINQQAEPYTWTTATRVRREDGTIQLPPNFNLQAMKSLKSPPLGLKFEITPELLAKLTRAPLVAPARVNQPPEKAGKSPPASKYPVTSISIGPTWRRESRREDDLTLKLYLTMKKLVWEFIEEKIEVSWSDITAIQARAPYDDQPAGVLRIQLGKKPLFFRKTPTGGWEPTSDFTVVGDALYHRIHEAEFGHRGVLHELHSALLRSDRRLLELSMNPFPAYPTSTLGDQSAPSSTTAVGVGESSRNAGHQNQPLPEENINCS